MTGRMTRFVTLTIALICCSVHVLGAPSPDPRFEYVNIRFETNTPEDHYNNFVGGTDPGISPVTGQSPDVLLLEQSSSPSAASESESGNPFSNVADVSSGEDLSSFSKDELESRRELLLAILEQTSAQLGESTPSSERANQMEKGTSYPKEESKEAKLDETTNTNDSLDIQQYIPQKTTQEQKNVKMLKSDDSLGRTATETSQSKGIGTCFILFLSGMLITMFYP